MQDQGWRSAVNQWRRGGQFIDWQGHQIFVRDDGPVDRPAILLIHGFPTSSWDWQPIWNGLRESYRLVAMDMLGFGFSDKPNRRNYTIHRQADLIEAVIVSRGLTAYHVLAHDYGDTVAQELLARQLDGSGTGHWLSGCFLNGGLFPETHRALLTQKLLLSPVGPWVNALSGFGRFSDNFCRVFGPDTKPGTEDLAAFWHIINENHGKHVFHNLITYMRDRLIHRDRWVHALRDAAVPLALINGSLDPVSGSHMVARYRELSCRMDFFGELPRIGHYPQVEAPRGVLDHYTDFLNSIA